MKAFTVCWRELRSYFTSSVAFALLAVFLLLSGYFFYTDLIFLILFGGYVLPTGLWQPFFLDVRQLVLLVLPLVTMRLFAEERKLGTIELLWTYPVRDVEIVAGKYLAAWLFFIAMVVPTLVAPAAFYHYYQFDILPVAAGYFGLILLGSAFVACGMFVSSLTENQVVSAMVTYGLLLFFWFVTWNEEAANEQLLSVLLRLSLFDRFFNFTRGVIDTKDVVYFVLFGGLFFFFTILSLGSRKWRGLP